MNHLPRVKNTWTVGTVLAGLMSAASLFTMLIGGVWFAARIDIATKPVPTMLTLQNLHSQQVAVLQDQQHYTDMRYAEIMLELAKINEKLDDQHRSSK